MSTAILPVLPGVSYPVSRSPVFASTVQQNISGKETRIALQSFPRWKWELSYNILRSSAALAEYQALVGFFNSRLGSFDTFLYLDADDHSVTGQAIGSGNGSTTVFQLVRAFGGFVEPMLAPNIAGTINVYLNGTLQSPSTYTVNGWGTSNSNGPGSIVFNTAPANGVAITADFSYYWPCRMSADTLATSLMMNQFYEVKKFAFTSVKN